MFRFDVLGDTGEHACGDLTQQVGGGLCQMQSGNSLSASSCAQLVCDDGQRFFQLSAGCGTLGTAMRCKVVQNIARCIPGA